MSKPRRDNLAEIDALSRSALKAMKELDRQKRGLEADRQPIRKFQDELVDVLGPSGTLGDAGALASDPEVHSRLKAALNARHPREVAAALDRLAPAAMAVRQGEDHTAVPETPDARDLIDACMAVRRHLNGLRWLA